MRVLALFTLVAMLAAPSYAQESASDDTAPAPTSEPTPKPEKLTWTDLLYYRGFGPMMSKETFRFDAATDFFDSSWSAVEMRWNTPEEDSKRFNVESAVGIFFERYTLVGRRTLHNGSSISDTTLFVMGGRQYLLAPPDRGMQGYGAFELGIGCELSTHKVLDAPTGLYADVQDRTRWLGYPGLAFGVRVKPIKWVVLNGEVRGRLLISGTLTPAFQATLGVGLSQ
jgi:hypothetical protein